MKKTIKKVCALGLAAIAGCTGMVACKGNGGDKNSITLNYFLSGYGADWIKAVVKDYTENVNPNVEIQLKQSGSNEDAKSKIQTTACDDLYFAETDFFRMQSHLSNLDDLYEMEVYGEPGVKVKDKISDEMLSYYAEKGGYYQVPHSNMYGYNWVYNKTLLDKIFPDGYDLPNTTDEFLAFGDELFQEGVYLTATALGGKRYEEYLQYSFRGWLMQMMGAEANSNFFKGMYLNEAAELVLAETSPQPLYEANRVAIEETYDFAKKLCTPTTISGNEVQYLHNYSKTFGFKDVDLVFYGGKYNGVELPQTAFHYTGIWLEQEIAAYVKNGIIDASQEIVAIKMPVMSKIIDVLPDKSVKDDAMLSAVIDAIDAGNTSYEGVSEKDFARIKEARNIKAEMINPVMLIPQHASNKDISKAFIAYLFSDRAQKIAAKETKGISVLPYGYTPTDEDMGFEISSYVKSVLAIQKDSVLCDVAQNYNAFATATQLTWYFDDSVIGNNPLAKAFFMNANCPTKEQIVDKTVSHFSNGWDIMVETYRGFIK